MPRTTPDFIRISSILRTVLFFSLHPFKNQLPIGCLAAAFDLSSLGYSKPKDPQFFGLHFILTLPTVQMMFFVRVALFREIASRWDWDTQVHHGKHRTLVLVEEWEGILAARDECNLLGDSRSFSFKISCRPQARTRNLEALKIQVLRRPPTLVPASQY